MAYSMQISDFFLSGRRWPGVGVAVLAVFLSGCATRLTANVTRFHQWPANTQGATYAIAPAWQAMQGVPLPVNSQQQPPADETVALSDLEFKTYAGYLDQGLQAQELVPAARPDQARMIVGMEVQSRRRTIQKRVPEYRPMLWMGMGYRWFHWSYGPFAYHPWDYYDDWGERVVTQPVQQYRLRLRISDRGQSTTAAAPTVFDASASYTGQPLALAAVMPYLVRAVFDDFPGINGKAQQVIFDSKTGERLETKTP
ncbi:MAG: DUF4136 domain-containing protein [Brachymonas sp.]